MKKVCSVILAVIIMIGFSSGLNYKAYADDLNEADSIVVNKEKAPIMPTSDVKYYKFIPEISSYYKIYFNPINSSSLTLYDGSYNVLDSYNGNEAYEKFMYFNAGLTYFFQVNCKSGTVLPYRLKLLNAYNIYFNGNGGLPDYPSKLISKGDKYGELPQAKRPKYVFDGWYTDPTNGNEITAKTEHTNEDSITVYAHWIPRPVVYCDGREVEEFDISAGSGVFSIADSSGLINATWTSSDVSVISVVKKTGSYTVTGLGNAVVTASYTKNNKSYKIDTVIHSKSFANSVNTITPHQTEYFVGDSFNPNVTFNAIFDDGSQKKITLTESDAALFNGMYGDTALVGPHTIGFNYMGAYVSYNYNVYESAQYTNVALSQSSYTYNKKSHKPVVTVTDRFGNAIDPSNYTVTYSKGRKNVGVYSVTVTFKNYYIGSVTKAFTVKPKPVNIKKLKGSKKSLKAQWKKQTAQVTGYQIQYSTTKAFTKKTTKTLTVKKNKTTAATLKKLKGGKKYYVKIRTYKTVKQNGKSVKIYSDWSKVKSVKVKK